MNVTNSKINFFKPRVGFFTPVLIFMAVISISFTGCKPADQPVQKPAKKKPPLVTTAPAETMELVHALNLTGTVEPYRLARLASPAEGPVVNLRVREGDTVSAGEKLLAIGRKTGVKALISSLREELKKEEDNLNRTRRLVEGNALPAEQMDLARANFEKVRAQLVGAQESEEDFGVSAPFLGMVSRLLVSEGDFVAPRAGLVEIYDPATLVLRTAVQERYTVRLKKNMPAEILLDAYPDRTFTGNITRLFPYLDGQMRTRTVEIHINEPADLLPGMFGRIRLALESFPEALTIPVQAVRETPKGESILFTIKDGRAVQRKVKTGIEDHGRIQVLTGLNAGEEAIVSGHEKLKDGTEIRRPDTSSGKPPENGGKPGIAEGAHP